MNAYRSVCSMCISSAVLLVMLCMPTEARAQKTLQSFGVTVKHGQPVYPLPTNVALGLFNPEDPFLDVAYYANARLPDGQGRVQVFQNLGNGLFSGEPVFDRRLSGEVAAMQWRMRNPYFRSPSDLLITYTDGREETIANEWMREQTRSFASLPQTTGSFPPLNFREVWRSAPNPTPSSQVLAGDIDNDGKTELVYMFYPAFGDSITRLVVYKNVAPGSYVVDWDTSTTTFGGLWAITDIDNDGNKEIVTFYSQRGSINTLPTLALFEYLGPRQYRVYHTNIGVQRPVFKVLETDINHNGIKELTVLTSNPSAPQDPTLIYIAEFVAKGPSPSGWTMAFNQQIARFYGYCFNIAVGQVDGTGWDEIIPAGGSFGFHEPVPVQYLWYSGLPSPNNWIPREIYTGLESGTGAVMFANLDADTMKEFVSGAPGPIGRGSMFALKYLHDTTWSVMWADSSLRNAPLWVNTGMLGGQPVVAGANTWDLSPLDTLYATLNVYEPSGGRLGKWQHNSIYIQQFHFLDIDHNGKTNLIFAQTSNVQGRYLKDYESDSTTSAEEKRKPGEFSLMQNFPNPFNPVTIIRFTLPLRARIALRVYNILGQPVATLLDGEKDLGEHEILWDASSYPSGVYFYRLQSTEVTLTKKMLLIR